MSLYLGLDGGGTKTASVILNELGEELGRGVGGPSNIATCSDEQLRASVSEACLTALTAAGLPAATRFESVCAGVAGFTSKRRRTDFAKLLQELAPADLHRVEPDYTAAYWGATEGEPGIVVIAGTGAVVYGRHESGEDCRVDGRGFLLGDRGSAFYAGWNFLRMLVRRLDDTQPLSDLDRDVMAKIGVEDADDLVEWTYRDLAPSRIAQVAEILATHAAAGDAAAVTLIRGCGTWLRVSAEQVREKLALPAATPIYPLGSLWKSGEQIVEGFLHGNAFMPGLAPEILRQPKHDAAFGAALIAKQ